MIAAFSPFSITRHFNVHLINESKKGQRGVITSPISEAASISTSEQFGSGIK